MSVIRCPHCGVSNRAGSNFCNNCGTELAALDQESTAHQADGDAAARDNIRDEVIDTSTEEPDAATDDERQTLDPERQTDSVDHVDSIALIESDPAVDEFDAEADDRLAPAIHPDRTYADEGLASVQSDTQREDAAAQISATDSPANPAPRDIPALITSAPSTRQIAGLLEPIAVAQDIGAAETASMRGIPSLTGRSSAGLDDEQLRQISRLMSADPILADAEMRPSARAETNLHRPWIYWLIGLALALPIFLQLTTPTGTTQAWPGVAQAFDTIQALPEEASVLVLWGYDPATAGEMDIVALPIIQHLLNRRSQLVTVSLLPTGPASARRLLARAAAELRPIDNAGIAIDNAALGPAPIAGGYLPGGATILPLLGQDLRAALPAISPLLDRAVGPRAAPDLTLVVAAQAEDVQQWLEQGHPLNDVPVVAAVSAGADPILRPYWDSRQLQGLVSGFDGAATYMARYEPLLAGTSSVLFRQQQHHLVAQNWGHVAVIALIILGNLSVFVRSRHRG